MLRLLFSNIAHIWSFSEQTLMSIMFSNMSPKLWIVALGIPKLSEGPITQLKSVTSEHRMKTPRSPALVHIDMAYYDYAWYVILSFFCNKHMESNFNRSNPIRNCDSLELISASNAWIWSTNPSHSYADHFVCRTSIKPRMQAGTSKTEHISEIFTFFVIEKFQVCLRLSDREYFCALLLRIAFM